MADSSSTASSAVYSMDSVVRRHHVYKEIWTSFIGKELSCKGEVGNIHDMYAVTVMKKGARASNCCRSSPQANFNSLSLFFEKRRHKVKVFDSAYTSLDQLDILPTIQNIFCSPDARYSLLTHKCNLLIPTIVVCLQWQ